MKNPAQQTFAIYECTRTEIQNIILSLNPRKATGPCSIPTNILHLLKDDISNPLSTIFNLSLKTGIYPELLKSAKVIPIFKKGSKLQTNNYRPISLLSNLNKILEKIMFTRVYSFLEDNDILYKLQFGFRKKHSTNHALIDITENIRQTLDKGKYACGIFIDLQKAFDTVNHNILTSKMHHYGIRGIANDWFKSYLSDRSQFVSIQGFESETEKVKHGVPQGSVLGPLLFLLYINDLHTCIKYSKVYHFADDTNLLNTNSSPKQMQKQVNIDLKLLYEWLLANKISLNCAKTELIFFHKPGHPITGFSFKIKMNGHKLLPSDHIKYLGIYLDSTLSGNYHCKQLITKLKRANGMLSKIRHYVPKEELKSIYYAIFSSHMTYGCQIWGQKITSHNEKVFKLQNKAVKIINFKSYDSDPDPLYKECGILKLQDFVKTQNCLLVHDYMNNTLPSCFQDYYFKTNTMQIQTRNSWLGCLFVPSINSTTYGLNSITQQAIYNWNSTTKAHKTNISDLSRYQLKELLIKSYNNNY